MNEITFLFGINNKEDDEEEEQVHYWTDQAKQETRTEEEASVPSRDSRPPRDRSVSEVDGVTHQEDSLSTSSP